MFGEKRAASGTQFELHRVLTVMAHMFILAHVCVCLMRVCAMCFYSYCQYLFLSLLSLFRLFRMWLIPYSVLFSKSNGHLSACLLCFRNVPVVSIETGVGSSQAGVYPALVTACRTVVKRELEDAW